MSLPPYNTRPPDAQDLRTLNAWMSERALDQALEPDRLAPDAPVGPVPLRYDAGVPFHKLDPGAVCLLLPDREAGWAWGPVYVLLEHRAPDGTLSLIPFGRYHVPAVPGEVLTGLRRPLLRVLCLWNRRVMDPGTGRGVPAGHMPDRKLEEVRACLAGVDGPLRRGPPLVHPLDPRYRYLDEEIARLDTCITRSATFTEGDAGEDTPLDLNRHTWLLAAEGRRGGYGGGKADKDPGTPSGQ